MTITCALCHQPFDHTKCGMRPKYCPGCRRIANIERSKRNNLIYRRDNKPRVKLDHDLILSMYRQGKKYREISEITGVKLSSVKNIVYQMKHAGEIKPRRRYVSEIQEPLIPPGKRLENALPIIARRFPGKGIDWVKNVWLTGPAGKQFIQAGRYWV